LGGPLEGPVLQQGELSMICVGLSERDLKNFGGATGGPVKIWGAVAPLAPPISAPVSNWRGKRYEGKRGARKTILQRLHLAIYQSKM